MIRFARSVTNNVKSHTPQLKALHRKSTPQLTAAGIRSVTRNGHFRLTAGIRSVTRNGHFRLTHSSSSKGISDKNTRAADRDQYLFRIRMELARCRGART